MDIELEHIELGGRRIEIDGTYRQEGDGATLATVGGVILAGVFAGFITGKSGTIPQNRELTATLAHDLPVELPEGADTAPPPVTAQHRQQRAIRLATPTPSQTTQATTPPPTRRPAVVRIGGKQD